MSLLLHAYLIHAYPRMNSDKTTASELDKPHTQACKSLHSRNYGMPLVCVLSESREITRK